MKKNNNIVDILSTESKEWIGLDAALCKHRKGESGRLVLAADPTEPNTYYCKICRTKLHMNFITEAELAKAAETVMSAMNQLTTIPHSFVNRLSDDERRAVFKVMLEINSEYHNKVIPLSNREE